MAKIPSIIHVREGYAANLTAQSLEKGTVKNHRMAINRLIDVTGDIPISKLKPQHVEWMFGNNEWKPRTRNLYLSILRSFIQYCHRMGYLPRDFDPTEGWRNTKVVDGDATRLPVEQFVPLMEACESERDRALIAIGLFTFCRGSEIANIRISDVDFQRSTIDIYRMKTKQFDTIPMVADLKVELLTWLNAYEEEMEQPLRSEWYLIPAKTKPEFAWSDGEWAQPDPASQRLVPTRPVSHLYEHVKKPLRALGYTNDRLGGHTLRRSGARAYFDYLREQGYDGALRAVSALLGHANTATTETYLGVNLDRLRRNESLAGKPMFGTLLASSDTVTMMRQEVNENGSGNDPVLRLVQSEAGGLPTDNSVGSEAEHGLGG